MTDETNVAPAETAGAVITDTPSRPHELGNQIPEEANTRAIERKQNEANEAAKTNMDAVKRALEASKAKATEALKAKEAKEATVNEPAVSKAKPAEKPAEKAADKNAEKAELSGDKSNTAAKEPAIAQTPAQPAPVEDKPTVVQPPVERKPYHEPPSRFLDPSKKEWESVPDSVKEDVHRVIAENEKGIQKYKGDAERFEKIREFDETARKNGREGVHESLKQIVEIEQAFQRDPIEGLKRVTDHFGINLQAVAAHIMGENPDSRVQEAHGRIQELEARIQHMEMAAKAPDLVAEFAAQNERFEELSDVIATLLETGTAKDLQSAYKLAAVLKAPASKAAPAQPEVQISQPLKPAESVPAQTQAPALNPAGSKSVSGAPTGGVSPASKQSVPKSNAEAVARAMARAGA